MGNFGKLIFIVIIGLFLNSCDQQSIEETVNIDRSQNVTIYRDAYGVPHIYGKTDGDTAFGMGYAQAEDNFNQLELNFIVGIGRSAELFGEASFISDWVTHSFENNQLSIRDYEQASPQVKALLDGYADGINHYINKHPQLDRKLLDHIEPWYPLALIRRWYYLGGFLGRLGFTADQRTAAFEAINGEIMNVAQAEILFSELKDREEYGSNSWAANGAKIEGTGSYLFINPHLPSFGMGQVYEAHMMSDEGWNFSGYARFGYPLPYIGFGENLGWMSTDNYGDQEDAWTEHFDDPQNPLNYRYGDSTRAASQWTGEIKIKGGEIRTVKFRKTHHGPVVALRDGKFLSAKLATYDQPGWLDQWYNMQRAENLVEFKAAVAPLRMQFGNIMYADRDGNIYYIYNGAFPKKSDKFNWNEPVDGSDPETEWERYHSLDEIPQVLNPVSHMMQNTNTSPFMVSMSDSDAKKEDFPIYMAREGDNARSRNARRILNSHETFDFATWERQSLDTTMMEWNISKVLIMAAYGDSGAENAQRTAKLAPVIEHLKNWDGSTNLQTTQATLYADWLDGLYVGKARGFDPSAEEIISTLEAVMDRLVDDWGTWQVAWGDINRYQRPKLDERGTPMFSDDEPSIPAPGVTGRSGGSHIDNGRRRDDLKRRYKVGGNSYTAIVDFPKDPEQRVISKSIHAFGASGDPASPHYLDQAKLLSKSQYKDAWLYLDDVKAHATRTYHPGEE